MVNYVFKIRKNEYDINLYIYHTIEELQDVKIDGLGSLSGMVDIPSQLDYDQLVNDAQKIRLVNL